MVLNFFSFVYLSSVYRILKNRVNCSKTVLLGTFGVTIFCLCLHTDTFVYIYIKPSFVGFSLQFVNGALWAVNNMAHCFGLALPSRDARMIAQAPAVLAVPWQRTDCSNCVFRAM
jgi:fatty-acid desaturase